MTKNGTIGRPADIQVGIRSAGETGRPVEGTAEVLSLLAGDADGGSVSGSAGSGLSGEHVAGGAGAGAYRPADRLSPATDAAQGGLSAESDLVGPLCGADQPARLHRTAGNGLETENRAGGQPLCELSLAEVIEAYFDCRRLKRNTANALAFELDYEKECIELWQELNERRYEPQRSIVFVVNLPVKREIFAADFRDRVVHHLIARRIYPLLEKQFLIDSYSTQKGKGTLFGIQRVEDHIRQCSENYTKDCWVMKLDIQGFFMSMDKHVLYHRIMTFLYERYDGNDLDLLEYMLRKTIYNRPEKNCFRKMPPKCWEGLPANKSLFGTDGLHGLPIGNLTSQLLALLYLDPLDHLITEDWGIVHYGRYVDDMVLVHPSKERLLEVRGLISEWLQTQGLTLHPRKTYLQHCAKGVRFVGSVIKPGRKYISSRTMGNFHRKLFHQNHLVESGRLLTEDEVRKFVAVVNSYMGMMLHFQSGRHFRRFLNRLSPLWYQYVYICKRDRKVKLTVRKKIKETIEVKAS